MKTIRQALIDEIAYPLGQGKIDNRLLSRGLDADSAIDADIINSDAFTGAVADCLFALIEAPNFSESDISISLQDRNLILKKANYLYTRVRDKSSIKYMQ